MFKVSYVLPSQSRVDSGRELQNVATTKMVPFTSWYSEQQRQRASRFAQQAENSAAF